MRSFHGQTGRLERPARLLDQSYKTIRRREPGQKKHCQLELQKITSNLAWWRVNLNKKGRASKYFRITVIRSHPYSHTPFSLEQDRAQKQVACACNIDNNFGQINHTSLLLLITHTQWAPFPFRPLPPPPTGATRIWL